MKGCVCLLHWKDPVWRWAFGFIPPRWYQLYLCRSSLDSFLLFLCVFQDPSSHFTFGYNLKEDNPVISPCPESITVSSCINATIKGEAVCIGKICLECIYLPRFSCNLSGLSSLMMLLRWCSLESHHYVTLCEYLLVIWCWQLLIAWAAFVLSFAIKSVVLNASQSAILKLVQFLLFEWHH